MRPIRGSVLVAMVLGLLAGGAASAQPRPWHAAQVSADRALQTPAVKRSAAYKAAAALPVRGWLAHSGYSRGQFGDGWTDVNRNGCDTRNDILQRDLSRRSMSGVCKVLSGQIRDPYTGELVFFVRGGASEIDIDHVVALSNAWSTGAAKWKFAKRVAIANDPLNLLAVGSSVNRQKSDSDAGEWLPPARGFRCTYVARQVAVKRKYGLWVTRSERTSMLRVLSSCPKVALPGPGKSPVYATGVGNGPVQANDGGSGSTKPVSSAGSGTDARYATCTAAKAAGLGPYYRGRDPEYSWYTDRDKDGIVCER